MTGVLLQTAQKHFSEALKDWATTAGYIRRNDTGKLLMIFGYFNLVCAGALILFSNITPAILLLPSIVYAATSAGTLIPGAQSKRTAAGRELWSEAGGFEKTIVTQSAHDRQNYSEEINLANENVPYAVAFSAAKNWTKNIR